jgi:hypothetical protein
VNVGFREAIMKIAFIALLLSTFSVAAQNNQIETAETIIAEQAAKEVIEALRLGKPFQKSSLSVVPNEKVAQIIHSAVASAVFGDDKIQNQQPFHAQRFGEFWVVYGTLPSGMLGGTAVTVIRASNGEVVRIIHGQ